MLNDKLGTVPQSDPKSGPKSGPKKYQWVIDKKENQ